MACGLCKEIYENKGITWKEHRNSELHINTLEEIVLACTIIIGNEVMIDITSSIFKRRCKNDTF